MKLADPFLHWFWKTQISVLRACPPLCGVVSSLSIGAENSPGIWVKTLLQAAVRMPRVIYLHWRNRREHRAVLSRVSVIVTTRCTLNCDKCMAHIPDLADHRDMPFSALHADMQALFACVDQVYATILTGGEAFLHPELDKILRLCAESGKAGSISVQTNGTVIPDGIVLTALKDAKASVKISRYAPALQPDAERLKAILKAYGIPYTHASGTFWRDTGKLGHPQKGSEKRRFGVCTVPLCWSYVDGKLHLCAQTALLLERGLLSGCEEDYIDMRTACPGAFRKKLRELLARRTVSACSYCLGDTYKTPKIPVAVQREPGLATPPSP